MGDDEVPAVICQRLPGRYQGMTEQPPRRREAASDAVQVAQGVVQPSSVDASGVMHANGYADVFARGRDGLIRDHLLFSDGAELSRFRVIQGATQQRRPLHAGDRYRMDARVLGWTPSHLHVFFQLWHGTDIAAACQQLLRFTGGPDAHEATMPAEAQTAAAQLFRNQEGLPLPLGADPTIRLPLG